MFNLDYNSHVAEKFNPGNTLSWPDLHVQASQDSQAKTLPRLTMSVTRKLWLE